MARRTSNYTFIDDAYIPYINDLFTLNGVTYGWIDPKYTSSNKGYADANGRDLDRPDRVYVAKHGNRWRQTKMSLDADNINTYLTGRQPELSAFSENGIAANAYDANSELVRPNIERYEYNDEVNKLRRDKELSAKLSSYTPLNFLNTIIPAHLISPTNYIGAVGEAARGNDNFFLNALSGNNKGIFSLSDDLENWSQEHPYLATAGNIVGDIAGFGALSDTARFMKAINTANRAVYGDMGTLGIMPRSAVRSNSSNMRNFTIDSKYKDILNKAFPSVDAAKKIEGIIKEGDQLIPFRTVEASDGKKLTSLMRKNAIPESDWSSAVKRMDNELIKQQNSILEPPRQIKNLYDKYNIDLSAESWFRDRLGWQSEDNPLGYTKLDIADWYSNADEYSQLTKDLIESGRLLKTENGWFADIDGTMRRMRDPEAYIVSNSKAFEPWKFRVDNDGNLFYSGMRKADAKKFAGLEEGIPALKWLSNNPRVTTAYGDLNIPEALRYRFNIVEADGTPLVVKRSNNPQASSFDYYGDGKHIIDATKGYENDVIEFPDYRDSFSDLMGTTHVIGKNVPYKVLRGNNGKFDPTKGAFWGVLPASILLGSGLNK